MYFEEELEISQARFDLSLDLKLGLKTSIKIGTRAGDMEKGEKYPIVELVFVIKVRAAERGHGRLAFTPHINTHTHAPTVSQDIYRDA